MVYEIVKYDMIGKMLHTYEEKPNLEYRDTNSGSSKGYYVKGTINEQAQRDWRWDYSTSIPKDAFPHTDKFLPYFADVTEDIPAYLKRSHNPQTWKGCQLMVEKHGGYLQFFHEPTGEVLRIAINSNTYRPLDVTFSL